MHNPLLQRKSPSYGQGLEATKITIVYATLHIYVIKYVSICTYIIVCIYVHMCVWCEKIMNVIMTLEICIDKFLVIRQYFSYQNFSLCYIHTYVSAICICDCICKMGPSLHSLTHIHTKLISHITMCNVKQEASFFLQDKILIRRFINFIWCGIINKSHWLGLWIDRLINFVRFGSCCTSNSIHT